MEFKVVIPARYGASRLPGKPLRELAGWPLVRHVHARARESGAEVVIATDDARIRDACEGFGAAVCMTAAEHESGTARIAEVVAQRGWDDAAIVVNLQGDEPLVPPALLRDVAADLAASRPGAVPPRPAPGRRTSATSASTPTARVSCGAT